MLHLSQNFLEKETMKSHVRRFHKIQIFDCQECGKKSKHQQAHNQHMEIVIMVPDFQNCKALEQLQPMYIG